MRDAGRITRRALLSSMAAVALISTLEAQSADVDAETITFRSGEVDVPAYLTKPRAAGRHPGVIVVHENRGLTEHIRDVARRFAAEGFVALAPDLRSRLAGTGPALMGAIDDLQAALARLAGHPSVDPSRLATVGFGWGAWRGFMLAAAAPSLRRVVVFYGSSPDSGFEKIQASVLAHYAQWDNQITGNALWTKEAMERAGKSFQYYVYPGTDQAFFNDTGPRYVPEAARLAWKRTIDFLKR